MDICLTVLGKLYLIISKVCNESRLLKSLTIRSKKYSKLVTMRISRIARKRLGIYSLYRLRYGCELGRKGLKEEKCTLGLEWTIMC